MAWKFLNIAKANARIDELEAQLVTANREREDISASIAAGETEAVKIAEALTAQVSTLSAENKQLSADLVTARASIASEGAEVARLKAELVEKEKEVTARATKQAVEIQAQLGQPGAPATPPTATSTAKPLFGLAKAIAAEKAETAARNSKNQ